MKSESKLLNLKRKLLEKKNKLEAMLFELRELNQGFLDFKKIVLKSDKISKIKDNTDFVKCFNILSKKIDNFSEKIEKIDVSKMPTPKVIIPNKFLISNIKDAKSEKVKIDWENQPKQKEIRFDFLSPIRNLKKSIESTITPVIDKITKYVTQPDRVIVSDNEIVEFYGDNKITYKIIDDGNKVEVKREI